MATIDELRKIRLAKLENIKRAGIWAYPLESKRTHEVAAVLADFDGLVESAKEVIVAGRVKSLRSHGALTFIDIQDVSGKIQALLRSDGMGEKSYQFFIDNFDIGDFVEIRGTVFVTKRGEKTVEAADYKMLAKSLLPLPEKWHGLQDVEERYRKRYLDLIFNDEIRAKFIIRTKIIKALREFLDTRGFMEVETPILQTIYGGATAKPFMTHLNAYDMDVFLRIAPELFLKRLLVGGFEKVYEIGKCFRNEGVDKQHNPDFTMIEFYWAYANYKDLMKLVEELFSKMIFEIFGTTKLPYQGNVIEYASPWPRVEYTELLKTEAGIDYWSINRDAMAAQAKKLGIEISPASGKAEIADEIFKKCVRPKIIQPAFLIHYPVECKPLAKQRDSGSDSLANFQLLINSFEIVNGFSEQNDPIEQDKRFKEQEKMFELGFEEAQRVDTDYIEALEYGMPPAAGLGMGIDRLVALLTDSNALREIILFPIMKPRS